MYFYKIFILSFVILFLGKIYNNGHYVYKKYVVYIVLEVLAMTISLYVYYFSTLTTEDKYLFLHDALLHF